ncbi:MAG: dephospho-CoA kinase, partial [Synergistaceae bacterium]|nr:dephospho-CoA kinase [Synergistaceae bacterium]
MGITVTGDIGAGKSTASKILSRLTGCPVIDAD